MVKKKKKDETFNPELCDHDPAPIPYDEWVKWYWEKKKTHNQVPCPNCGIYRNWELKNAD